MVAALTSAHQVQKVDVLGSEGSAGEGPSRACSTWADLPAATAEMRPLARSRVDAE